MFVLKGITAPLVILGSGPIANSTYPQEIWVPVSVRIHNCSAMFETLEYGGGYSGELIDQLRLETFVGGDQPYLVNHELQRLEDGDMELLNHVDWQGEFGVDAAVTPGQDLLPEPTVLCTGSGEVPCPSTAQEIADGMRHECDGILGLYSTMEDIYLVWGPFAKSADHALSNDVDFGHEVPEAGIETLPPAVSDTGAGAGFPAAHPIPATADAPQVAGNAHQPAKDKPIPTEVKSDPKKEQFYSKVLKQNQKLLGNCSEGDNLSFISYGDLFILSKSGKFNLYQNQVRTLRGYADTIEGTLRLAKAAISVAATADAPRKRGIREALSKISAYAIEFDDERGKLSAEDLDVLKKRNYQVALGASMGNHVEFYAANGVCFFSDPAAKFLGATPNDTKYLTWIRSQKDTVLGKVWANQADGLLYLTTRERLSGEIVRAIEDCSGLEFQTV